MIASYIGVNIYACVRGCVRVCAYEKHHQYIKISSAMEKLPVVFEIRQYTGISHVWDVMWCDLIVSFCVHLFFSYFIRCYKILKRIGADSLSRGFKKRQYLFLSLFFSIDFIYKGLMIIEIENQLKKNAVILYIKKSAWNLQAFGRYAACIDGDKRIKRTVFSSSLFSFFFYEHLKWIFYSNFSHTVTIPV